MNNLLVLALMIASCLADGGGFATYNTDYSGGRLGEGLGEGRGDGLGLPKAGTCPAKNIYQELELGPYCSNDEHCHGVQICTYAGGNGQRCQIPAEFERPGSCNQNYVIISGRRVACNHDTTCPYGGKCCKRFSSGQVDTCTYPDFEGPIPGIPGGLGGPGPVYPSYGQGSHGRNGPVYPLVGQGGHGHIPAYPQRSNVY